MASKFVSNIDSSKVHFGENYPDENKTYPGTEGMIIGCLQRIATSQEAIAKNYLNLLKEVEYYKKRYEDRQAHIDTLYKSQAALKGHVNRLKRLLNQK